MVNAFVFLPYILFRVLERNRTGVKCVRARKSERASEWERGRVSLRNWLMQCQSLINLKSKTYRIGQQAADSGKSCSLNPKAVCWQTPSYSEEVSHCSNKAFNWLDKAHPHDRGQLASFKVHQFKMLILKHHHRKIQKSIWPNIWALTSLSLKFPLQ